MAKGGCVWLGGICGEGGHVWQRGGVHGEGEGRGHAWQRGVCMAKGGCVCGKGGGMHGEEEGHAWQRGWHAW